MRGWWLVGWGPDRAELARGQRKLLLRCVYLPVGFFSEGEPLCLRAAEKEGVAGKD